MDIGQYIKSLPRAERAKERRRIAKAMGVSEILVRKWCTGERVVMATKLEDLARVTGRKVVPIHQRPDLAGLLGRDPRAVA